MYYIDEDGNINKALINNVSHKKTLTQVEEDKIEKIGYMNAVKNKLYFSVEDENFIYCIPSYSVTSKDDLTYCGYTTAPAGHLCVYDEKMFYSNINGTVPVSYRIADTDASKENDISILEWLKNKRLNRNTNGLKLLPLNDTKDHSNILTPKDIYSLCSPAVFYIECFDEDGEICCAGSGFFINSNGLAVTNYHVIHNAKKIKIKLPTGKQYEVEKVITKDLIKDIAIIKISGSDFDYLSVGDSSKITGGDKIYAIGSPLGLSNSISEGMISNPNRDIGLGYPWFQITAPVSTGSSGGALINEYGEVVGITAASLEDGQNLNFAIPINYIFTLYIE